MASIKGLFIVVMKQPTGRADRAVRPYVVGADRRVGQMLCLSRLQAGLSLFAGVVP